MLSRAERETIITFSEEPKEAAEIYTHNPALKAKLARMEAEYPKEVQRNPRQYDQAEGGERYIVSREWVLRALKGIRPRAERHITERQREALAKGRKTKNKGRKTKNQKEARN